MPELECSRLRSTPRFRQSRKAEIQTLPIVGAKARLTLPDEYRVTDAPSLVRALAYMNKRRGFELPGTGDYDQRFRRHLRQAKQLIEQTGPEEVERRLVVAIQVVRHPFGITFLADEYRWSETYPPGREVR